MREEKEAETVKKQKNMPLYLAAVICAASVLLMCVVLNNRKIETQPFTPPPFEEEAQSGVPEVPATLGWSEVDAKFYKASICGVVSITDGAADLWMTNPESNTVWLKLRILNAEGEILAETGILRPGEYLQTVEFNTVPEPGETIGLKLMAYEPETYYSAGSVVLNTTVSEGGTT